MTQATVCWISSSKNFLIIKHILCLRPIAFFYSFCGDLRDYNLQKSSIVTLTCEFCVWNWTAASFFQQQCDWFIASSDEWIENNQLDREMGCWKNTQKACRSLAWRLVICKLRWIFCARNPLENMVNCLIMNLDITKLRYCEKNLRVFKPSLYIGHGQHRVGGILLKARSTICDTTGKVNSERYIGEKSVV